MIMARDWSKHSAHKEDMEQPVQDLYKSQYSL